MTAAALSKRATLLANGTISITRAFVLSVVGVGDDSDSKMRLLLAIIVIIYLVGVGVVLSPIIRATWNTEPASVLADRVVQALPDALTWPMKAAHAFAGS
jgi:hypothetical protein